MRGESDIGQKGEKSSLMTRRQLLGLGAVATCGVTALMMLRKQRSSLVSINDFDLDLPEVKYERPLSTVGSNFRYSIKPVKGIPQSWVNQKGLDVWRYANFIQDLGLKNITPYEVLYPHFKTRGRHRNSIPPRYLWSNLVPTLRVVDKIATHMNARLKPLVSVYRSPSYNRAVRGRGKSTHLLNKAIDVQFHGVAAPVVAKVARKFRDAGHFKGGVGSYSTFTHIDTRGHNVDW